MEATAQSKTERPSSILKEDLETIDPLPDHPVIDHVRDHATIHWSVVPRRRETA
ncbi:MAG TPA: hypothetical protein VN894_20130 [Polyangiaceae bacterium]|nr:hypothetical protein [Polyangiaceae bacterium]